MKKIFLTFILIFSLSFLGGCGKVNDVEIDKNYIMLSISQNANGTTNQSLAFGVNSDFLRQYSKSIQEEMIFKQNLIKEVETLRNEFLFSFALTYMNNPQEEYKINQGVLLSQVGYNADGDYIGFEITFTSSGAWQYYHPNKENPNENSQKNSKKGNIFYSKQQSEGIFPFSAQINEELKVGEKYKNCYLSALKNLSFADKVKENYHPDFVYNYASPYSKFHSNAQLTFKGTDNNYHHVWIEESLEDCQNIKLNVYLIYKGWWIFFTLLISLFVMTIAIVTSHKKSKIKINH